ncbi:hypothetical protein OG921_24135 [Aldersonia sp. NBC_00410]|uniref:hypothetical protein n=1 Tax=Aldersonia sp. NBC_00410 TaxID=2975954 RepID=UPI002256799D|nr:hypothetical protein [Aldersonia sp. NBC_00410]MCX5046265.1 hypothetical protein [Aldersonia sp. NBC_00410]
MPTLKSERDKALKAARERLERKAELIGDLGELVYQEKDQLAGLEKTRAAIGDAYDAAIDAGWTNAELKDMGFQRPRGHQRLKGAATNGHSPNGHLTTAPTPPVDNAPTNGHPPTDSPLVTAPQEYGG